MFMLLTFNPDIGQNVPSGKGMFSQALASIKLKVIIAKIDFIILDYDLVWRLLMTVKDPCKCCNLYLLYIPYPEKKNW